MGRLLIVLCALAALALWAPLATATSAEEARDAAAAVTANAYLRVGRAPDMRAARREARVARRELLGVVRDLDAPAHGTPAEARERRVTRGWVVAMAGRWGLLAQGRISPAVLDAELRRLDAVYGPRLDAAVRLHWEDAGTVARHHAPRVAWSLGLALVALWLVRLATGTGGRARVVPWPPRTTRT